MSKRQTNGRSLALRAAKAPNLENHIEKLDEYSLLNIFQYLSHEECLTARLVCNNWSKIMFRGKHFRNQTALKLEHVQMSKTSLPWTLLQTHNFSNIKMGHGLIFINSGDYLDFVKDLALCVQSADFSAINSFYVLETVKSFSKLRHLVMGNFSSDVYGNLPTNIETIIITGKELFGLPSTWCLANFQKFTSKYKNLKRLSADWVAVLPEDYYDPAHTFFEISPELQSKLYPFPMLRVRREINFLDKPTLRPEDVLDANTYECRFRMKYELPNHYLDHIGLQKFDTYNLHRDVPENRIDKKPLFIFDECGNCQLPESLMNLSDIDLMFADGQVDRFICGSSTTLTQLKLQGRFDIEPDLRDWPMLPALRRLDLTHPALSYDGVCNLIEKCPNVGFVRFYGSKVSLKCFEKMLVGWKKLKRVGVLLKTYPLNPKKRLELQKKLNIIIIHTQKHNDLLGRHYLAEYHLIKVHSPNDFLGFEYYNNLSLTDEPSVLVKDQTFQEKYLATLNQRMHSILGFAESVALAMGENHAGEI